MKRTIALLLLAALPAMAQNSGSRIEIQELAAVQKPLRGVATRAPGRLPDIEVAYRAFAAGELEAAETMFSLLIERRPSPAAFLLRGCTRYTRAMLARDGGTLIEGAKADVRRAFDMNESLWLDPDSFSPRLITFLEEVRQRE